MKKSHYGSKRELLVEDSIIEEILNLMQYYSYP
jgi:hypothetical protein